MKATTTKKKAMKISKSYLPVSSPELVPPPVQNELKGTEGSLLALIERAVSNPRLDVVKMKSLLEMHMEIMRTKAEIEYNSAMRDVQQNIQPVAAESENKHTKSWYAKLEAIDTAIRPIYTGAGFSLTYNSSTLADGRVQVICDVRHIAGHKERHELTGALDLSGSKGTANKTSIQGLGSTVSYLRRYLACMIFNVIIKGEDKDGNREGSAKPVDEFADMVKNDTNTEVDVEKFRKDLIGHALKIDRYKFINDNIDVIHALAKEGKEDVIQQFHTLADKGR